MKNVKYFRITIALLFLTAAVVYLFIGPETVGVSVVAPKVQIIPSVLSETMGATLVWLLMSLAFGRVYCSTVCPIGTLQDISWRMGRRFQRNKGYVSSGKYKCRIPIFGVYILMLIVGPVGAAALFEPWEIMRDMSFPFNHTAEESAWMMLGVGVVVGIIGGIGSVLIILVWALFRGRDFCNKVCPIGTALGAISSQSIYHIEIDPDRCTNCMKCEQNCRAHSIKVLSRYVDNVRCVRCFECVAECPDEAIHYQPNRNRPATPLMRRRQTTVK